MEHESAPALPPWSDGERLVDVLAGLLRRPEWMRDGLCQEYPEVSFFPERGESSAEAKAVCRRCAVQGECLSYAVETGAHGIWGGTSAKERRAARRTAA